MYFWSPISLWRWPKSKKISAIGLSKYVKIKLYLLSPFWAIFRCKKVRVTSQRVRIKICYTLFHTHYSWSTSCKKSCSSTFQFCSYRSQKSLQNNFNLDFQVRLLFLIPCLYYGKNKLNQLKQNLMLKRLAPISNPKN